MNREVGRLAGAGALLGLVGSVVALLVATGREEETPEDTNDDE